MGSEVTQILGAIESGDVQSAGRLLPLIYTELRTLAASRIAKEQPGQTLDATSLVHEAYLRLAGPHDGPRWQSRAHFFAAAAEAMRRILIDNARRKLAIKRGGQKAREDLDADQLVAPLLDGQILALDEALTKLESERPEHAKLVKLRYFAGLTMQEAAELLGVSLATAERRWTYSRAWLRLCIDGEPGKEK